MSVPELILVRLPVPPIPPANVVEVVSPTVRALPPSVTTEPADPDSDPIVSPDAVIPEMSNVAPLAVTLTGAVVASEPLPFKESMPALSVVPPV